MWELCSVHTIWWQRFSAWTEYRTSMEKYNNRTDIIQNITVLGESVAIFIFERSFAVQLYTFYSFFGLLKFVRWVTVDSERYTQYRNDVFSGSFVAWWWDRRTKTHASRGPTLDKSYYKSQKKEATFSILGNVFALPVTVLLSDLDSRV